MIKPSITIRNSGWLLVQRGIHIITNFLFVAVIPRLMGPETYGRYSLIFSILICFVFIGDMGVTHIMGRYTCQFLKNPEKRKQFFTGVFMLALMSSVALSISYIILTYSWLQDIDRVVLFTLSMAVGFRILGNFFYTLFLGLNQSARWGMGNIFRRFASILFIIIGFYWKGLYGACLGILISEMVVFIVGLVWTHSYFSPSFSWKAINEVTPYLRIGFIFFASTIVLIIFRRSGEALIRIFTNDYTQIGFYGLSIDIYNTITLTMMQFTISFVPLFTVLRLENKISTLTKWITRLHQMYVIAASILFFCVILLGEDIILSLLGEDYIPVARQIIPLSLAWIIFSMASVLRILTLIFNSPGIALKAAGLLFVTFLIFSIPLIIRQGSYGACIALFIALMIYTFFLIWNTQHLVRYSLKKWGYSIGIMILFLPIVWLKSSWQINLTLFIGFVIGYSSLLLKLKIVNISEIKLAYQSIFGRDIQSEHQWNAL